jgi:hypothetical protein
LTVWTQQTCLRGEHAIAEPKRLRYRILHVAAASPATRGAPHCIANRLPRPDVTADHPTKALDPPPTTLDDESRLRLSVGHRGAVAVLDVQRLG